MWRLQVNLALFSFAALTRFFLDWKLILFLLFRFPSILKQDPIETAISSNAAKAAVSTTSSLDSVTGTAPTTSEKNPWEASSQGDGQALAANEESLWEALNQWRSSSRPANEESPPSDASSQWESPPQKSSLAPLGKEMFRHIYWHPCILCLITHGYGTRVQCSGCVFIWYESGSSILGWIPIPIQGFDDQKLKKNYSWKKNCWDQKLQLTYP